MPACQVCGKSQSKLNRGVLCRECHESRNDENSNDPLFGLTDQELNDLPELPDDWITKPFQHLTGGHLLKITMMANSAINTKIDKLNKRMDTLETSWQTNITAIDKNKDTIAENERRLAEIDGTLTNVKKTLLNQQNFMEQVQRTHLARNVMITGVPNDNLAINDSVLTNTDEKVLAILNQLDDGINDSDYELKTFEPPEGRTTHSVKVIFNCMDTKKKIITEARRLKDINALNMIYIKNDETKLARSENYRLRVKARALRAQFPNAAVKIEKGVLKQDGVVVDKFDLNNQIFC